MSTPAMLPQSSTETSPQQPSADTERQPAADTERQRFAEAETASLLQRILAQSDGPLSAAQIIKAVPRSVKIKPEAAEQILLREAAAGQIFEYPKVRNKPQFGIRPPREFARILILRKLQGPAMTQTDALKAISGKAFDGLTKRDREQLFAELVSEQLVFECPPFIGERKSTRPKYNGRRPDPAEYLKDAIRKVAATLGLAPETAFEAARACAESEIRELAFEREEHPAAAVAEPPSEKTQQNLLSNAGVQDERLLEAMRTINPRVESGDMVDIISLRRELDAHMPGSDFDQAVLDAVYRRRFAIHRYDRPDLISAEQRALLVRDEHGQYYNTISLWRN